MSKLMSSLVAATVVGAFSLSAFAADAAPAAAEKPMAAEKPAAAPKKAKAKRHTIKAAKKVEEKKGDEKK